MQRVNTALEKEGVAVYAISYDSTRLLASFATENAIAFPMLSDEGSRVITRLGLLNPHVQEQHAVFGIKPNPAYEGVPYPAVFFLDESGVVIDRRIHENYRVRETGHGLISRILGKDPPAELEYQAATRGMGVRVWADSPSYAGYQELRLSIELSIAKGWHVYGYPVPDGYRALTVEADRIEGVEVGTIRWPDPETFEFAGLGEQFYVYEGNVMGVAHMRILQQRQGTVVIKGCIEFQMCSHNECLPPASVPWELALPERPHISRAQPDTGLSG